LAESILDLGPQCFHGGNTGKEAMFYNIRALGLRVFHSTNTIPFCNSALHQNQKSIHSHHFFPLAFFIRFLSGSAKESWMDL
jgi:hypothetical protein